MSPALTAAFVIAEILGIGYIDVAIGALIPAVLYYAALFVAVDLRAARLGLKSEEGDPGNTLRRVMINGGYLLLVPATLVFMLAVMKYSPLKAGIYTIIVNLLLFLAKEIIVSRVISRTVVIAVAVGVHAFAYVAAVFFGHWPGVIVYGLLLAALAWAAHHPRYLSIAFLGQFVRRAAASERRASGSPGHSPAEFGHGAVR